MELKLYQMFISQKCPFLSVILVHLSRHEFNVCWIQQNCESDVAGEEFICQFEVALIVNLSLIWTLKYLSCFTW